MSAVERTQQSRKRSRLRYAALGGLACLGLALVWFLGGLRLFVFPASYEPRQDDSVDAVYVLGMVTADRLERGVELVESGISDHLVVTTTEQLPLDEFCSQERSFTVHCVTPDPITTEGEARQWRQMAQAQQWNSVMAVTNRSHVTRTQLYFDRCFPGEVFVVDDEAEVAWSWTRQFIYETGAVLKFVASRDC